MEQRFHDIGRGRRNLKSQYHPEYVGCKIEYGTDDPARVADPETVCENCQKYDIYGHSVASFSKTAQTENGYIY